MNSTRGSNALFTTETSLVDGACKGLLAINPSLRFDSQHRVVYAPPKASEPRVTVLSGGGSGHEPAHAGYVGNGMLDAAVCGAIFASPNVLQVQAGLRMIDSGKGPLIIVKNYTGDKLNFGLALEKHRATSKADARMIMVGDDVCIGRSRCGVVGRRGLAGTILAHKIAGGASSAGPSLPEVAGITQYVVDRLATIGCGLQGCSVPGQQDIVVSTEDEVELGLGIHNQPGSRKLKPQPSAKLLVQTMLDLILSPTDQERNYLDRSVRKDQSDYVMLVNNLGGLPTLESTALRGIVTQQLVNDYNIRPCRTYVGSFLSALNAPGFSVTLLRLPSSNDAERESMQQILSYLDAPITAQGWKSGPRDISESLPSTEHATQVIEHESFQCGIPSLPCDAELFARTIEYVHRSLVAAEPDLTAYDTLMGDGDCGTTLVSGASTVLGSLDYMEKSSLTHGMSALSELVSKGMGGTSGALYAIFFTAFANAAKEAAGTSSCSLRLISKLTSHAVTTLEQYTAARVRDRTMMDALIPFADTLGQKTQEDCSDADALTSAVEAAKKGADATSHMKTTFGRSTYVDAESKNDSTQGIPDPGALGVVAIVQGIAAAVHLDVSVPDTARPVA